MLAQTTLPVGLRSYPCFRESLPAIELREGRYLLRVATTPEDLEAVLRLRFRVFNLELGEGLESSFATGLDLDEYDPGCHHLMVIEVESGNLVGTYRLQTGEMARAGKGFYSSEVFDLSHLPEEMLLDSVELARACIEKEHRNTQALFLLWRGLAKYILYNRRRFFFGCCSLTSQDPREGWLVMKQLEADGHVKFDSLVLPRAGCECYPPGFEVNDPFEVKLPRLFRTYIRFGSKVCGPPAIDRSFGTIDYFMLFDRQAMDAHTRQLFFGD